MAKSDLTWRFFGKDVTASKALKGVGSTADNVSRGMGSKMSGAFAGIGTAAVAAGAVIAVDFAQKSVSAFMDAEESQAKFENSLAKNGIAKYTKQIDDLAGALALKTKFDDDATRSGAAVLANFGLTGNELQRVIPLVQDYAAFTGKDMPAAASVLGKAFMGNTKALKSLGIAYKPTGDKAKDMAAIMKLLNDRVGGFAEKQGKTAAGTAAILSNQFGEVQEQIGSYLVPVLTTLGQWLLNTVIPAFQSLASYLGQYVGPAFKFVGDAWSVFTEALSGGEVTTQGALGYVGQFAYFILDTVIPAVKGLADGFMTKVWPAIQKVAGIIAENLQPVVEALAEFWTTTLWPAIQRVIPVLSKVASVVGTVVAALAIAVSWILGKVVPVLLNILKPAINIIVTVFESVATAVEWVVDHFDDLVEFVKGLPQKFRDGLSTLAEVLTAPFRLAFNGIAMLWNNTVGRLSFTAPDWIPGIGGNGWDVPDIPMLAKGGIVTRPTLALIGEAGPEAVLPLSRAGGMGGEQLHLHFHGPVVGPGAGAWLAKQIEQAQGTGRARRKAA